MQHVGRFIFIFEEKLVMFVIDDLVSVFVFRHVLIPSSIIEDFTIITPFEGQIATDWLKLFISWLASVNPAGLQIMYTLLLRKLSNIQLRSTKTQTQVQLQDLEIVSTKR